MSRPSVFADIQPVVAAPKPRAAKVEKVKKEAPPPRGEVEMFRTSVYIARPVHDVLREIAFHERCKVHDLFNEGLEHVLKKRRHPSIRGIIDQKT